MPDDELALLPQPPTRGAPTPRPTAKGTANLPPNSFSGPLTARPADLGRQGVPQQVLRQVAHRRRVVHQRQQEAEERRGGDKVVTGW